MGKDLQEQATNASIQLSAGEVINLKKMLLDYCKKTYIQSPIFTNENVAYLDFALEWAIKRVEQSLNPRKSSTGNLVIGDGSWLANAQNYFDVLVQGPVTVNDYINEYMQRVGLITQNQVDINQGINR